MADDLTTLADLVKINDNNLADIDGVSDLLNKAPLIGSLAADESSNGTTHKYLKETGAPVVGFRAPNEGRDHDKSTDEVVTTDLKVLDASFSVDVTIPDGYAKGPDVWLGREGKRHLREAYFVAEKQFINGQGDGQATGFVGMADVLNDLAIETVTGAGGAANLSSIYFIRTNNDGTDVMAIGGGQEIGAGVDIMWREPVITSKTDGTGKTFPAYLVPITAWLGLQVGGKYSMGRLCNIPAGVGGDTAGAVTDALIYSALEQMPFDPDLIVMNRRSRRQLRESRTATNATGAPAPRPTEVEGIPILKVESITNAETAVA
ncbi:MAG: major capsid protein [Planctomycetota bacterium]